MTNETTASQPTPHQNTLDAITGAIAYGRQGTNPPPSPDHWLAEYWSIGQQLAQLGKTSAWDNVTPIASQPKSIGDDAQFLSLMGYLAVSAKNAHTPNGADYYKSLFQQVITYIDSRAPAAQASATIQAAPEGYALVPLVMNPEMRRVLDDEGWAWEDLLGAAEAITDEQYAMIAAATIQEPVMVAEPVGKVVLFGGDLKEVSWAKGKMPAPGTKLYAAPMVADPAGVGAADNWPALLVDIDLVAQRARFESFAWPKRLNFRKHADQQYVEVDTADAWKGWIAHASTVKAVPSEALDEAAKRVVMAIENLGHAEGGLSGRDELEKACDQLSAAIAAPLADKTGGGE